MAVKVKRALISVSNKIGLLKFSEVLQSLGVEIVSTGVHTSSSLKLD